MVTLEKYKGLKTRYVCPSCGNRKSFVRYVDDEGNHIADHVGKCNRDIKCSYHYTPKQYYSDNPVDKPNFVIKPKQPEPKKEPSYIPSEIAEKSGYHFDQNYFVQHLFKIFDSDTVNRLVNQYHIGTSSHWKGATVFWQLDMNNQFRTGKIMAYSPFKFNRIKEAYEINSQLFNDPNLPLNLKENVQKNQKILQNHLMKQGVFL